MLFLLVACAPSPPVAMCGGYEPPPVEPTLIPYSSGGGASLVLVAAPEGGSAWDPRLANATRVGWQGDARVEQQYDASGRLIRYEFDYLDTFCDFTDTWVWDDAGCPVVAAHEPTNPNDPDGPTPRFATASCDAEGHVVQVQGDEGHKAAFLYQEAEGRVASVHVDDEADGYFERSLGWEWKDDHVSALEEHRGTEWLSRQEWTWADEGPQRLVEDWGEDTSTATWTYGERGRVQTYAQGGEVVRGWNYSDEDAWFPSEELNSEGEVTWEFDWSCG